MYANRAERSWGRRTQRCGAFAAETGALASAAAPGCGTSPARRAGHSKQGYDRGVDGLTVGMHSLREIRSPPPQSGCACKHEASKCHPDYHKFTLVMRKRNYGVLQFENRIAMITCMCTACQGKQPPVKLNAWIDGDYSSISTPEGESLGIDHREVSLLLARLRLRTGQRTLRVFEGVKSTGDPCQTAAPAVVCLFAGV